MLDTLFEASEENKSVGTVIRNSANILRNRNQAARGGSRPSGNPSMEGGKWHDSQKHAYEVGKADATHKPKSQRVLTRAQMKNLSGYGRANVKK